MRSFRRTNNLTEQTRKKKRMTFTISQKQMQHFTWHYSHNLLQARWHYNNYLEHKYYYQTLKLQMDSLHFRTIKIEYFVTFIIIKYGMHLTMAISGCMCNRKLLYKATHFYWTYRVWWRTGSVRSITRRWCKGCNRPAPCTNIRSTQHYEGIKIKGEREKFDVITCFG